MSTTIDSKVVEMRFDNKQFESNVQTSLSTLDRLKQSLKFDGAVSGLDNINDAAKNVNMSGLGSAVNAVSMRFSALEVMAVTALANITNSVINTGKQMLHSLTIAPIKEGFDEYELKMGSVQTIMASTGESLETVNGYLRDLNTYSDKTIYSFADMTSNIGKFTNAGVKLEDAVKAIQGISNEAAVSGANVNEASRAMYNFAQALSAGSVKLIDWKSIENANMATVEFKTQLMETAVELGTLRKEGDRYVSTTTDLNGHVSEAFTSTSLFNESLSAQWMTTDVLVKTLGEYADETTEIGKKAFAAAQDVKTFSQLMDTLKEAVGSGWAETWEIIFGDFNETKELWTSISNTVGGFIDKMSDARNELLSDGFSSGWKNFLSSGIQSVTDFESVVTEVAKEHHVAIDDMIKDDRTFAKTLERGWMTTDILSESMDKYVNSLSEMTDKERKNAGYTKEQYKELRVLHEELKNGSVFVDEFVNKINRPSGRQNIFESIKNTISGFASVLNPIKEAFGEIFSKITSEQLYKFTENLREFTSHLQLSDTASANLKRTFKGLFAVLKTIKDAFTAAFSALSPLIGGASSLGEAILGVTAVFGDYLVKVSEFIARNDVFKTVFSGISALIQNAGKAIGFFVGYIKEKFVFPGFELFHSLLERIHARMSQVGDTASEMKSGVMSAFDTMGEALANCQFFKLLESIWNATKRIVEGIVNVLGKLMNTLTESLSNANFSGVIDLFNGVSFGVIAAGIYEFIHGFKKALDEVGSLKEGVLDILGGVKDCFKAYQDQLKAETLIKIATAIGILAASIVVISLIDSDKVSASLGAITVLFADLMASMAVFSKISGNVNNVTKSCTAMIAVSTSILILASALKKIASIDSDKMLGSLAGLASMMGMVVLTAKAMSTDGNAVIKGAAQMILFATAVKILASVCSDLSTLRWNELIKGLVGVGVLLAEISMFLRTAKFSGKAISTATGIVILSAALKILASACSDFGGLEWGEIGKGLTAIGLLLTEMALFTKATGNAKHVISTGVSLVAIAGAMKIFASAVADFGNLEWGAIARGLVALGGALAIVTTAVNFMPKNMVGIGVGLIALGAALKIVASALDSMGNFTWQEVAKGLVVLGGALAELAIGLKAMTGTLGGAAALIVAAGALAILTPVLSILGAMSWTAIAKGLVTIAGAFTVLGVAGAVLTPLVPAILGLSGAFVLVGASVLAVGAGLLAAGAGLSAVAVGLTALATAGAAGAAAIVASLTVIITGVAGLIPAIITKVGEAIIAFCKVIADGAPAIADAIKAVILNTVSVFTECVPAIVDGLFVFVTEVLESLAAYTPRIVDAIFEFVIGVLNGFAKNMPTLIKAAVDMFMSFFAGIADALTGIDTSVLIKGIAGIGLLSGMMLALGAIAGLVPTAMVGILGMGAVIAELALVLAAVGAFAKLPGLNWLIGEGGKLLQGIGTAIGGFVGGIVSGFMGGVSSQFPKIGEDLAAFMANVQPFIDGAKSFDASAMDGVKALAETIILLTAADILDGLTSWFTGKSSLSSFAEELVPFGKAMRDFSVAISGMDAELVSNAAIAGKTMAEMASTLPNSGGVVGFFAGENDMSAFGKQLVPFGEAMMGFAESVHGLDAEAVVNAATAGEAMAEMATTIPNAGGVVGFFTGENDMSTFGEQLVPFGEAMMGFSKAVKGLDAAVITESITAGKALVELANTVPNTGGAVAFFAGDNNMEIFGKQLVPFGEAMKQYSDSITGIDGDAIVNSATAGKALVELANTLPNTGGVVSWFTGDNDISAFGESLVSFGENFAAYANYMKGVDAGVLTVTTNAAQSIVNLQNSLPKTGGWFSDDATLADFGSDMSSFGFYFSSYYSYISGINVATLSGVTAEVDKLVALTKSMAGLDTSGMTNFGTSLKTLANGGIDQFIMAFTNAKARITQSASDMIQTFVNGVNAKKESFTNTFTLLVSSALTAIRNKQVEFNRVGQSLMINFIAGVREKGQAVQNAFVDVVSSALTVIRNKYMDFHNVGEYLVKGFAAGITENTYIAEARAREMARAAARAAAAELEVHSPSKVGYRIGGFFGMGFVNAIGDYADNAYEAGGSIARSAKEGLGRAISKIHDFIDGDIEISPTIRPVIDLSEVRSKAGELSTLLSQEHATQIGSSVRRVSEVVSSSDGACTTSNNFSFTQNNYSPKALSRVEIYRQTKNQFSAMERMVNT